MYTWRVLGPLNAERIWSHSPILILWFLKLHLSEIDKIDISIYIYISIIWDMSTIMLLVSLGCLWNQTSKSKKNRMVNPPATRLELLCLATLSPNHSVVQRNHSHGDPFRSFEISWDILRSLQILSVFFKSSKNQWLLWLQDGATWCYGTKTTLWPPRMHWAPQPEDSLKSYQSE